MSHFDYKFFYRRNLPHIQPLGATFFITFRLAGSLPQLLLRQWKEEKHRHLVEQARITSEHERAKRGQEWQRRWFRKFEASLDKAQVGPVWLKNEQVAAQVAESLRYRDGRVYRLDAYCIMPNHVHVVFAPLETQTDGYDAQTNSLCYDTVQTDGYDAQTNSLRYDTVQTDSLHYDAQIDGLSYESLAVIMQSLKGYTARKANCLLGRRGAFWAHESFDRYVRDEREWERTVAYVLNNPVKAGLAQNWQEWRWNYYQYAT